MDCCVLRICRDKKSKKRDNLEEDVLTDSCCGIAFGNYVLAPGALFNSFISESEESLIRIIKCLPFNVLIDAAPVQELNGALEIEMCLHESFDRVKICFLFRNRTVHSFFTRLYGQLKTFDGFDSCEDNAANLNELFVVLKRDQLHTDYNAILREAQELADQEPVVGDRVEIISTPFGHVMPEVFRNSHSRGIVSNAYQDCVYLTDAKTVIGCEGAPVRLSRNKRLRGLVLVTVAWSNGEWLGFTIFASVQRIVNDLLHLPSGIDRPLVPIQPPLIYDRVYRIECGTERGTGFAVGDGLLLTCGHVVAGHSQNASFCTNRFGHRFKTDVIYANQTSAPFDLGVLTLSVGEELITSPFFRFANLTPRKGDDVFTVGFASPFDTIITNTPTISSGIISKVLTVNDEPVMIISDCPVQSGVSGGPLLNAAGDIIGVVTSHLQDRGTSTHYPNINFSVPVYCNRVRRALTAYADSKEARVLLDLISADSETMRLWAMHGPLKSRL